MNDFQSYLDHALSTIEIANDNHSTSIYDYDIVYEVCQLITNTRHTLRITQQQLANKSGISQANISKIENGNYNPSISILKRIAEGMGKRLVINFISLEEYYNVNLH